MSEPALRFTGLELDEAVVRALQAVLPRMAERTVTAVTVEVPSYADAFSGRMGQTIENAVQMALGAFLRLATRGRGLRPGTTLSPALDGAYELGRGEARQGRSMDALLSAYRVGARVAWRELSSTAVAAGLPAATIARFAELVFAFIDELSASSVSGHADELATTGRVRQRYLDRLAQELLAGEPVETLRASAERADWQPPETLTAVLVPRPRPVALAARFGQSTLQLSEDLPGVDAAESLAVLLVPDMAGAARRQLLSALVREGAGGAGPAVVAGAVVLSACAAGAETVEHQRFRRRRRVDTDEHLVELVLGADREAADDLRRVHWRRWRSCRRTPPSGWPRPCDRGCCTRAARRGRRRSVRARPDGALPDDPAARAVRGPACRPRTVLELTLALGLGAERTGGGGHS